MRIKAAVMAIGVIGGILLPWNAQADWVGVSTTLPAADIRWVAVEPGVLYAASGRRLFKSIDNGRSWKSVFMAWGFTSQIQAVYPDPSKPGVLYVSTGNGVWRSQNSGKDWSLFYRGVGGETKNVFCIAAHADHGGQIWLGTATGLVAVESVSGQAQKIPGFPSIAVYSILIDSSESNRFLVSASYGVYQSLDSGIHWERVLAHSPADSDTDENLLKQAGVEEIVLSPMTANLIQQPILGKAILPTPRGIYEASGDTDWKLVEGKISAGGKVHYLAVSSRYLYVATDRGVYRRDFSSSGFFPLSAGLGSEEVRMILYDASKDRLLAATRKGIFQLAHPDAEGQPSAPIVIKTSTAEEIKPVTEIPAAGDILKSFEGEPTISQIQRAAIEYAEVHPRKIQAWRKAAARKAWFPKVSVYQKLGRDQNIDIDRGGTGDADKFIKGPDEDTGYLTVDMSWDLGELIWNGDQTSIDSRSKLMADLRDDVLNEVTHLYYERRRLQVEMALKPASKVFIRIEKQLRLEELTANIDGMTGGYFSAHAKTSAQA